MNLSQQTFFLFVCVIVQCSGECGSGKDECSGHGYFGSVDEDGDCECICDVGWQGATCSEREEVPTLDCPAGQFPLLGGFIVYEDMHNSEIRSVNCPDGFAGSARLQCKNGAIHLLGGSCWIVYHDIETHAPTQSPSNHVFNIIPSTIPPTTIEATTTTAEFFSTSAGPTSPPTLFPTMSDIQPTTQTNSKTTDASIDTTLETSHVPIQTTLETTPSSGIDLTSTLTSFSPSRTTLTPETKLNTGTHAIYTTTENIKLDESTSFEETTESLSTLTSDPVFITSSTVSTTTESTATLSEILSTTSITEESNDDGTVYVEAHAAKNEDENITTILPLSTIILIIVIVLMILGYASLKYRKRKRKRNIRFKRMDKGSEGDIVSPSKGSPSVIMFDESEIFSTPKLQKPDSLFNLKEGFSYADYITKSAKNITGRGRAPTFTIQLDSNPNNIPEVDLYGIGSISPIYSEGGRNAGSDQNETPKQQSDSELEEETELYHQRQTSAVYGEENRPIPSVGSISQNRVYHKPSIVEPELHNPHEGRDNSYSVSIGKFSGFSATPTSEDDILVDDDLNRHSLDSNSYSGRLSNSSNSRTQTAHPRRPCHQTYLSNDQNVSRYYKRYGRDNQTSSGEYSLAVPKPVRKFVTRKNYSKVTGVQYTDDYGNNDIRVAGRPSAAEESGESFSQNKLTRRRQSQTKPQQIKSPSLANVFVSNLVKKFSPRKAKRFDHGFVAQQQSPSQNDFLSIYRHKQPNNAYNEHRNIGNYSKQYNASPNHQKNMHTKGKPYPRRKFARNGTKNTTPKLYSPAQRHQQHQRHYVQNQHKPPSQFIQSPNQRPLPHSYSSPMSHIASPHFENSPHSTRSSSTTLNHSAAPSPQYFHDNVNSPPYPRGRKRDPSISSQFVHYVAE